MEAGDIKGPSEGQLDALKTAIDMIRREEGAEAIMDLSQPPKPLDSISTGSLPLDIALGIGGIPKGRIVEIYGPESSGKTTFCYHCIASVQREGGIAAFIDAEHAMDIKYAQDVGVDVQHLVASQPDYGEQALKVVEKLVQSGAVQLVVVDSVAALTPKAEIDGEIGDSFVGTQARLMSQALRKLAADTNRNQCTIIFTNQLREKIGVMFGCFDYHARVVLADGSTEKIGKIVNQRLPVEVMSMDPASGEISPRKVVDYYKNGQTDEWVKLEVAAAGGSGRRKLSCTAEHVILTPNGERTAGELNEGDEVLVAVKDYTLGYDQRQMILGGLLGDGSLRRASAHNVSFRVGHGGAQREYAEWKQEVLAPFANKMSEPGTKVNGFDTLPMHQLAELQAGAYGVTGRQVSDQMVAELDAPAVAVWYGDDGTFSGSYERWGHGKAELCCKSLSHEDKERLAARLEELGMGRPTVGERSLLFSGERTAQLQEKIAPYLHPSLDYKLHPRFRGQFDWRPEINDADLNGTRLASRTRLKAVPMKVISKRVIPATPRHRNRFDLQVEGNHTYLVDHVVVHNSPETTPGGKALKFYASVRLDIRRIETLKKGTDAYGSRVRVKVVKNKVAPPWRQAEFDVLYGKGFDRFGALIDLGVADKIVTKSGSFFSYGDTRLGQGKANASEFLAAHPELADEIDAKIRGDKLGVEGDITEVLGHKVEEGEEGAPEALVDSAAAIAASDKG